MKRFVWAIAAAVALVACAEDDPAGVPMGEYWQPDVGSQKTVIVHVVSRAAINRIGVDRGQRLASGSQYGGLAFFWDKMVVGGQEVPVCNLYIIPELFNTGTLQHELRHCFQGVFHY